MAGPYAIASTSDGDTTWGADMRTMATDVHDRLTVLETPTLNTQTGTSYTLVLSDAWKVVERSNAAANTLTIPLNSSVAFPIGVMVYICQMGAGVTTIVATGGVTIRSRGGALVMGGQYAEAAIRKRGTDEWVLSGDVT